MQESRGTMTRISHNDSIEGRGRSLHLQTHTVEESRKIISTLFEGGRVLSKLEDRYDGSLPETDLREQVEKVHRERINEIELLYAITVKIQTVRHAASLTKLGNQYLRWNLLDEAITVSHTKNSTITVIESVTPVTKEITIYPDWNLVSLAAVPEPNMLPDVLNNVDITYVFGYQSEIISMISLMSSISNVFTIRSKCSIEIRTT